MPLTDHWPLHAQVVFRAMQSHAEHTEAGEGRASETTLLLSRAEGQGTCPGSYISGLLKAPQRPKHLTLAVR